VVAGFDRPSADRAAKWSEDNAVPVLLLAPPSAGHMPRTSAVVLGERPEREVAMLVEALVKHGVKTAAFVADTTEDEAAGRAAEGSHGLVLLPTVRCDIPLTEASKPRFPIESWLSAGAQGWLI